MLALATNIILGLRNLKKAKEQKQQYNSAMDELYHQFDGTPYEDIAHNNPYFKDTYGDSSLIDRLGNFFGIKTAEDKAQSANLQNAKIETSNIAKQQYQEIYESPVEQVAREKAAGINSDLNGGQNINSGEAAENDQQISPVDYASIIDSEAQKFSSIITDGLALGLQMFSGIQTINGQILDNRNKQILNASGLYDMAINLLSNKGSSFLGNGEISVTDYFNQSNLFRGLNPSDKSQLASLLNAFSDSPLVNARKSGYQKQFGENRVGAALAQASPFFAADGADDLAMSFARYYQKQNYLVNKMKLKLDKIMIQNQQTLQEGLNPALAAEQANSQAQFSIDYTAVQSAALEFEKGMNEAKNNLLHNLYKKASEGKKGASAALLGISLVGSAVSSIAGNAGSLLNTIASPVPIHTHTTYNNVY